MAGDYVTCDNAELSVQDLFKMLLEDDGNGCPVLRSSASITSIVQKDTELKYATDPGAADLRILASIHYDSAGAIDSTTWYNLDLTPYVPVGTPVLEGEDNIILALINDAVKAITKTDNFDIVSDTSTLPANVYSYSVLNIGTIDVTIDGKAIPPGLGFSFSGDLKEKIAGGKTYNATGGLLLITWIN